MTDDRWAHIERLLEDAAALSGDDRTAFLDRACPPELRAELDRLLAADADATDFFDDLSGALTADASLVGSTLGAWRIIGVLGQGGMGTVYRAARADGAYDLEAALKVLDSVRPDVVARFERERQILARLDHPGVARLLDGGQTPEGRPYLVMELVEGAPITDHAAQRGLDIDARLSLFVAVCEVVQAAHRQLIVHRDIKPSNVFVTDGGAVKLLDFGIARLLDDETDGAQTMTEHRALTPEYAAPEQVRGEVPTTATDVYALGVLLYELLAGTRPFDVPRRLAHEAARVILEEEPERPSTAVTHADEALALAASRDDIRRRLEGDLDAVCLKALRKEPERRYGTAEALSRDVDRHLRGLTVEARPDTVGYRASRFVRRNRRALAVGALAVLGLVGGLGAALWQASEARAERDRAAASAREAALAGAFLGDVLAQTGDVSAGAVVLALVDAAVARADSALRTAPGARAAVYEGLGRVYLEHSRPLRARALLRRAVALRRSQAPRPDSALAAALITYGESFASQTGFAPDSARLAFEESAQMYQAADTRDRPALARALLQWAQFLPHDHPAKDSLFQEAMAMHGRVYGPRSGEVGRALMTYHVFGFGSSDQAVMQEATERALAIFLEVHGENHVSTAEALHELGLHFERSGDVDRAIEYQVRSARSAAHALPPGHSVRVDIEINTGATLYVAEDWVGADTLFSDAVREARAVGYDGFGPLGRGLIWLGRLRAAQGRARDAESASREAVAVYDENSAASVALTDLAERRATRGDRAEAESLYREALQRSEGSEFEGRSLSLLADFLEQTGQADEARTLRQRRDAL